MNVPRLIIVYFNNTFDAGVIGTAVLYCIVFGSCRLALKTVEILTDSLDLSDFASKIIHPIVRLLDSSRERMLPLELTKQAMATLCSLVAQLGKKYRIFKPMVHKTLQRQKISDPKYSSLVRDIVEVSGNLLISNVIVIRSYVWTKLRVVKS